MNNKLVILLILILALISISVASAEDVSTINTTDTHSIANELETINNAEINDAATLKIEETHSNDAVASEKNENQLLVSDNLTNNVNKAITTSDANSTEKVDSQINTINNSNVFQNEINYGGEIIENGVLGMSPDQELLGGITGITVDTVAYPNIPTITVSVTKYTSEYDVNVMDENYINKITIGRTEYKGSSTSFSFTPPLLNAGNYIVVCSDAQAWFTVNKGTPNITASGTTIDYGGTETVRANLNISVKGTVTFTLKNSAGSEVDSKTVSIDGNSVSTDFTGLKAGSYTVTAKFNGEDTNYKEATSSATSFTVNKVDSSINVTGIPSNLKAGDNATIVVQVPSDATGNVTITVNGKSYNAGVQTGGMASITTDKLSADTYSITAVYNGDDNYKSSTNNTESFTVDRIASTIQVVVPEIVGHDSNATITVIVPVNATGKVTVTVNGKSYNTTVNEGDNGVATITIDKLSVGAYDVVATYNGNKNYTEATNDTVDLFVRQVIYVNSTGGMDDYNGKDWKNAVKTISRALELVDNGGIIKLADVVHEVDTTLVVSKNVVIIGQVGASITNKGNGNRLFNISNNAVVEMHNVSFNNSIVGGGASIFNNGTLTLVNSYFINNAASDLGLGGAIYNNATLNLVNSVFENNTAVSGGAIYNNGITNYNNVTFINNTAKSGFGGAIYNKGSDVIINSNFVNNSALYNCGGAIYGAGDKLVIQDSNFINNSAKLSGGVIYNENTDDVMIDNSTFTGNYAGSGGVIINYADDNFTITDSTFANNSASDAGGAIYNAGSELNITTSVFKNNTAVYGGAIDNSGDNVTISGSSFKNNDATNGVAIYNNGILKLTDNSYEDIGDNKTYIYNNGKLSSVIVTVLGNNTINTIYGKVIQLFANITSDGASVASQKFHFVINDVKYESTSLNNGSYVFNEYIVDFAGNRTVNVVYEGVVADSIQVRTGLLNVSKATPTINTTNVTEKYGVNGTIKVNISKYMNGTIPTGNVTISGENITTQTIDLVDGVVSFKLEILPVGNYTIKITYNGDDNYTMNSTSIWFNVTQSTPDASVNGSKVTYGENGTISVEVFKYGNGTIPTGSVTISGDGITQQTKELGDGKVSFDVGVLTAGNYSVTVTYNGNDNYTIASNSTWVNITQKTPDTSVIGSKVTYGVNGTVSVEVFKYGNGTVPTGSVTITGEGIAEQTKELGDGKVSFDVGVLTAGNHSILVTYNGNDNYTSVVNGTWVNVTQSTSKMDINGSEVTYGVDGTITVVLSKFENGAVPTGSVTISGVGITEQTIELVGGKVSFDVGVLAVGNYSIAVTYNGNNNYTTTTNSAWVNVTRATPGVSAKNITVVYGENGTLVVFVFNHMDGVNATGEVTISGIGDNQTKSLTNGVVEFTVAEGIGVGNYTVSVVYSGDKNYTESSGSTWVNVTKTMPNMSVNGSIVTYGENGTVTVELLKYNDGAIPTGNVTISGVGITEQIKELTGGKVSFDVGVLTAGAYNVSVVYNGDKNHAKSVNGTNIIVNKATPSIGVNDTQVIYGGDGIIRVELCRNLNGVVPTGNVTILLNNRSYTVNLVDGVATLLSNDLNATRYPVSVRYNGDVNYTLNNASSYFVVDKAASSVSVGVDSIVYGENVTICVNVTSGATGNITITVNGKFYTLNITKDSITQVIGGLNASNYSVGVKYNGDNNYNVSSNVTGFDVIQANLTIDIVVPCEIVSDKNATIMVFVPVDATGNITLTVDNKVYSVNIDNGIANVTIDKLVAGKYNLTAFYSGDNNYRSSSSVVGIVSKVTGYNVTIDIPEFIVGNETTITIDLPEDATGNVTITVDGKNYTGEVKNGTAVITIPPLSLGEYNITIDYSGDNKYTSFINETNVTVASTKFILTTSDVTLFYRDGSTWVALLTDLKGNPVANQNISFTINGLTYIRTTDVNGTARLTVNLNPGVYTGVVSFNNTCKNVAIVVNSTISAHDVVKMYRNDTQFYATFYGANGEVLVNAEVSFNINGVFYTKTTDANGTAKLNINLEAGNYTLTATNPFNGEENSFVVVVKSLIETNDLIKYYNNASQFEAKVYDSNGSLAVNKNVSFNINGVFYTRTSDSNGIAKLSINLRPGEYIITTMYDGLEVGNKVSVLPTLVASDLTAKYGEGSIFQVKTLDGQGNPLANQNITFNIHGVFYNKTTGDDGIAKLNINLMKGEYIITSYWNDYQVGNKIKIN